MGYIKEPKGIDFIVAPTVLTADDTRAIRVAIANYKQTGKSTLVKEGIMQHPIKRHSKTANHKHKKTVQHLRKTSVKK